MPEVLLNAVCEGEVAQAPYRFLLAFLDNAFRFRRFAPLAQGVQIGKPQQFAAHPSIGNRIRLRANR